MIDIKDLKEYINVFEECSLQTLELEDEDGRILMEKPQPEEVVQQIVAPPVVEEKYAEIQQPELTQNSSKTINSPMVGVFYSASSPDTKPFATVGKEVKKGDVVCIVEAMKIMNEIIAEESGIITEILVRNGDVVEYGQPLFRLS